MKPLFSRSFGAGLAVLLALTWAAPASAFCRTTTTPSTSDTGCSTQGAPLYHPIANVSVRVVDEGAPIPTDVLEAKLRAAAATWAAANAKCTPGVSITVGDRLPKGTKVASFVPGGENVNAVGVSSVASGIELALAELHFSASSGAILDVDLKINPTTAWSFSDVPSAEGTDLETVLLHSVGHMLGLAHVDDPNSVMYASYEPGSARRTLSDDDAAGVCAIYPNTAQRLAAAGLVPTSQCATSTGDPANGCAEPRASSSDSGCSMSRSRGALSGFVTAIPLLGLVWRRRRAHR